MKTYSINHPSTVGETLSKFEACLNGLYDATETVVKKIEQGLSTKRNARKILSQEIQDLLGKDLISACIMIALQNTFNKNGIDPKDSTERHEMSQMLHEEMTKVLRHCPALKRRSDRIEIILEDVRNLTASDSTAREVLDFLKKYYANNLQEPIEIEIIESSEILSTVPERHETTCVPPGPASSSS